MEIVYRKLSELKPNPKNPRKATDGAIARLAASMKENPKFFEARPVLLSDRTGELVIIGGERRSEAAALLKMKTVPTILMSGLTEAQEDEILIKDNTHSGVWDEQKLAKWDKGQLQAWNVEGIKWPEAPKSEENLPEELLGRDLSADELPKIVGEDKVAMERIIIVYPANQKDVLKNLLGLAALDKVVYPLAELVK